MAVTRERITNTGFGMQNVDPDATRHRAWAIGEREGYLILWLRDHWYRRDPDGIWEKAADSVLTVDSELAQPKPVAYGSIGPLIDAGTPVDWVVGYGAVSGGNAELRSPELMAWTGLPAPSGVVVESRPTAAFEDWDLGRSGRTGSATINASDQTYYEPFYGSGFASSDSAVQIRWDASLNVWASTGGWLSNSAKTSFANEIACFDMVASLSERIVYISAVKSDRSLILWKIQDNAQTEVATRVAHSSNTGNQRLVMCYLPGGQLGIATMDTAVSGGRPNVWSTTYDPSEDAWGGWQRVETASDWGGDTMSPLIGWARYPTTSFMRLALTRIRSNPSNNDTFLYTVAANEPPTAPGWLIESGAAHDRASAFTLEWEFNDPDPSDTQSAYRIRRTDNRGTYYRTGSGWTTTLDASSKLIGPATTLTLPAGWAASGQGTHRYYVQTWDAENEQSPWSAALNANHGTKDNPTITSPAENAEVAQMQTFTWTSASQSAYRIEIRGGSATGRVIYDSGEILGTTKQHTLTFSTNNVDRWIVLCTWSRLLVMSDPVVRQVRVRYTPPIAPTVTVEAFDDDAGIRVTTVQATIPGGSSAPAVETYDVWRRQGTDSSTAIKIAADIDAAQDEYWDYTAGSGIDYSYRVTVQGSDLTTESGWVN